MRLKKLSRISVAGRMSGIKNTKIVRRLNGARLYKEGSKRKMRGDWYGAVKVRSLLGLLCSFSLLLSLP